MSSRSLDVSHLIPVLEALSPEEAYEFLRDLFETFKNQIEPRIIQLNAAIKEEDESGVRKVVHFIAGSASNMGMVQLASFCADIEAAIKANIFKDYKGFREEFDRLLAENLHAFEVWCESYN